MSSPGIVPSQISTALRVGSAAALAFAAMISVWASIGPAASQESTCDSRENVHQSLEQGFGEAPAAFLRRILHGLVAAASLSGAVTVALWALAGRTL